MSGFEMKGFDVKNSQIFGRLIIGGAGVLLKLTIQQR